MNDDKKRSRDGWFGLGVVLGAVALVLTLCAIWTNGDTANRFAESALLFFVLTVATVTVGARQ